MHGFAGSCCSSLDGVVKDGSWLPSCDLVPSHCKKTLQMSRATYGLCKPSTRQEECTHAWCTVYRRSILSR
ncbi:hypothetical protein BRADI_2g34632v3 [Brachypodium distachyon]|uniref:Uncharacterized protein n=1 Tax=Brachypodium distachyon TaxID=15368 RepID=A0A0Q3J3M5_BRADI|nr:hypothetical protein BRADI_2g34632v3 [Brachypodium distachyon]